MAYLREIKPSCIDFSFEQVNKSNARNIEFFIDLQIAHVLLRFVDSDANDELVEKFQSPRRTCLVAVLVLVLDPQLTTRWNND